MPSTVRLYDICSGHGPCPPRLNISASPNVFINNLGAHRVGDAWSKHCNHTSTQASGSPNVFVNNLSQARIGDHIKCGSTNATGSPDTYAN